MRIAKKWDKPELVEAREQGRLTSIQKTMDIIRGKKKQDKKETKPTEHEKKCDQLRNEIRKLHAQKLQRLTVFELDNLLENYDNHWQHMYKKLYDDVCADLECDLNQDLIEMKRLVKPRQPKFSTGTLAQQKQAAERVATFHIKQQEVPSYTTRKRHVEQLEQHKKNVRRKIAKRLNQQKGKNEKNNSDEVTTDQQVIDSGDDKDIAKASNVKPAKLFDDNKYKNKAKKKTKKKTKTKPKAMPQPRLPFNAADKATE